MAPKISEDDKHNRIDGLDKIEAAVERAGRWPTPVRLQVTLWRDTNDGRVQVQAVSPEPDPLGTFDPTNAKDYGATRPKADGYLAEIPMHPGALMQLIAERNAAVRVANELRRQLKEAVGPADATGAYVYGANRADGIRPTVGSKWLTPRELVDALLADARLDPRNL